MPGRYEEAGVSLDAQEDMNRAAVEAAARTLRALGVSARGLGGYAAGVELPGGEYSLHMDGVGTKTVILERLGRLRVAGWDCVAMNVNDLVVEGFRPLLLVDYVAMPGPRPREFREIVEGVADAAVESGAALVGGETAMLPGLINGFDVVCAALGRREARPRRPEPGDVLVGVASNGLHANGYSLVRRVLEEKGIDYDAVVDGVELGEELARPTRIYVDLVMELYRSGAAKAAAHVTGGGWAKIARIIGEGLTARLRAPEPPAVFRVIQRLGGVSEEEMYRVFNMGVGLVVAASASRAAEVLEAAKRRGMEAWLLGRLERATGPRLVVEAPGGTVVKFP